MKILSVLFENFIALETGLNKRKVYIDFSVFKNQIILFVGPMGSGKTTILSHLIPYAQVGTLDERNSDPIIIPEENGLKEIVYDDGGVIYKIVHKYTWTKDHHAIKSYIERDGVELNPNGNQSSFKELVEEELGFTADLTRLLRLGPNVANVIELSTIERKEFIAKMQSATEIYLTIYKDMKEKARNLTAQSQLIARKLNGITDDDVEDIRNQGKVLAGKIAEEKEALAKLNKKLNTINAEVSMYLGGKSESDFKARMAFLRANIDNLATAIRNRNYEMEELMREYGSINDIMKALGKCEADINNNSQLIMAINRDNELLDKRRVELDNALKTVANNDYILGLQDEYNKYKETVTELREFVDGFECKYNSSEISGILSQIQAIDVELSGLIAENPNAVAAILNGGYDIVQSSKHQVEKLQGKIIKLRKSLDNTRYIDRYDVIDDLALPKECSIYHLCPFYYTHPNIVKSTTSKSDLTNQFTNINNEIDAINARIDELISYPSIYSRIEHCKKLFNAVAPMLKSIGALLIPSVKTILTKIAERVWYDYDVVMEVYEKCVKRELLATNEVRLIEVKANLDKSLKVDSTKLKDEYDDVISNIDNNKRTIADIEDAISSIRKEQARLEDARDKLQHLDEIKSKTKEMEDDRIKSTVELDGMDEKFKFIHESQDKISEIKEKIVDRDALLRSYESEATTNAVKLSSILEYREEFRTIANDLKALNAIIKASSPKKGIPLYHVEMFLNDCVDDINDMISIILPDVEICEFNINEKEFKIPYSKNGRIIDDVNSASQGERSIISIALSFALMMKTSSKYNIPLLDEVDEPIHDIERRSILLIFSSYFRKIKAEQAFFITHNDIFEGYPIDIITTSSDEHLDNKHGKVICLS